MSTKVSAADRAIGALHKPLPPMGLGHVTWAQSCHFSFLGKNVFFPSSSNFLFVVSQNIVE